MFNVVFVLLFLQSAINAEIWDSPVIETASGPVRGQSMELHTGNVVHSFWAIPFAAPPVGELRFARPVQPESWEEVFIADTLGTACPQSPGTIYTTHPGFDNIGEDCLNLNVFTPEILDPENPGSYPVMVWFYGGAYTGGANMQYPGHFFADADVVYVAVNYRVGNLGWTTTGDEVALGNWGLWDQNFGLQWVKDNIANFGGDPQQVTIFGQSAGAGSVSLQMMSPHSRGLFNAVIAQSGTDFSFWAINWPDQDPADYTRQVAEKLDCPTEGSQEMIDCLRTVPWEILWNTSFTCTEGHYCQGMAPVIDGEGGFIERHPIDQREDDSFNHVPLMTGTTTEDGSLYTLGLIPEAALGGFNRSEFERILRDRLLGIWAPQFTDEENEQLFDACNWYYSPWPHIDDEEANRQSFNFLITDVAFASPADSQAKSQSKQHRDEVYVYLFGYRSHNDTMPEWMGVTHAGELYHEFGWPLLQYNPDVREDTRIFFDIIDWTQMDEEYSVFMQTLWTNFAKYFNPTPEPVPSPTGQDAVWLPFEGWNVQDIHANFFYMDREKTETVSDFRQRDYAALMEYIPTVVSKRPGPRDTPGWPDDDDIWTPYQELIQQQPRSGLGITSNKVQSYIEQYLNERVAERLENDM